MTLRWFVVLGWLALAGVTVATFPAVAGGGGGLGGILPEDSPAIRAEARSYQLFDLPVLSRLAVVQHDPEGLAPETQAETIRTAAELNLRHLRQGFENAPNDEPLAALPVLNTDRLVPSASQDGTTAITFLFASPSPPPRLAARARDLLALARGAGLPAARQRAFRGVRVRTDDVGLPGRLRPRRHHLLRAVRHRGAAALGSDYNVFSVGEIWAEARKRPLRQALVDTVPRSGRIISTCGIALAGSLGLLVLIPLWPFQQIAFAMAVGLLLDVFVVRLLLEPSLITLVGPVSLWPLRPGRSTAGGEPAAELSAASP